MRPNYSWAEDWTCFSLPSLLDAEACEGLIARAVQRGFAPTGFDYPGSYRDNDRLVVDDPELARQLFERVRHELPATLPDGARLVGLNSRFRYCRYEGGQSFRIHRDGTHAETETMRSRLTLQVYLDDGFDGGRTRFYSSRLGACVGAVTPERGTAIVFDHRFWHDGEPVTRGTKHVLRTDVMYEHPPVVETADVEVLRGHRGYVYRVLSMSDGRLVTASRDRTIRLWGATPRVLEGHERSVHALCEVSPDVLWSGSRDHTVREWDLASNTSRLVAHTPATVLCLERFEGGVAAGGGDGVVRLFSASGEQTAVLAGHEGWVWSLARLGRREREWLVSGSEDGSVRLWSSSGCIDAARPGRGAVCSIAAIDEQTFAAGFADGHIIVYALTPTLTPIEVIAAHDGEVHALCSVCGLLASGGEDEHVRVHRVDGTCVQSWRHDDFVRSLAVIQSSEKTSLASASYDGTVQLHTLRHGRRNECSPWNRSSTAATT